MFVKRIVPLLAVYALPCTSWADITAFFDFASYNAAVGGDHTQFIGFETDQTGTPIILPGGTQNILGSVFSDDVTYSSPDFPSSLVNIADIGGTIQNEIGPFNSWTGTLLADYGAFNTATFFTIIQGETTTDINIYDGAALIGSVHPSIDGTSTVGLVSTTPFNRLEISGNFFAIDAHYNTEVIPAPGAALLGVVGLGLIGWFKRRFA